MDQHEYAREEGFCREKMWSVSLQSSVHCTVSITNSISSIDGENAVLRVWGGGGGWWWLGCLGFFGSSEGCFVSVDLQMKLRWFFS